MCHEKEDPMTRERQMTDKYANGKLPESILPPRFGHAVIWTCLTLFVHHLNIVIRQHRQYHLFVDVLLSLAVVQGSQQKQQQQQHHEGGMAASRGGRVRESQETGTNATAGQTNAYGLDHVAEAARSNRGRLRCQ